MKTELVSLSELLDEIVDNRGKTCPTAETGIPLIATNCIKNDSLYPVFENVRYVSQETYENWFRGHPKPGDIIFVNKGTPGRVCLVPDPIDFCIAQDMVALRANQEKVYPKFLFAVLRSPEIQDQVEQMHVGTLIPHFKKGDFDKFLLPVLDRDIQKSIGDFYFNLSAKIELNRRMNQTLETMAQALFKSWFVDFDPVTAKSEGRAPFGMSAETAALFPAEFVDSELGAIPQGWSGGKFGEIATIKHGFAFKGEYFSDEETDAILLTPGNFRIGGGFNHSKFKYYNGEIPSGYVLSQGDLIVTMTDLSKEGDTLGYSALVPTISGKKLLHNQRIGKVEINRINSWKVYLYFVMLQKDYRDCILGGATGTTVKHTSPSRICDYKMVIPPLPIIKEFENVANPMINRIEHNQQESRTLASIRDALLPRLLGGEVRVKG